MMSPALVEEFRKVLSEYKKVRIRENLSKVELHQAGKNWQLRFVPANGIISA